MGLTPLAGLLGRGLCVLVRHPLRRSGTCSELPSVPEICFWSVFDSLEECARQDEAVTGKFVLCRQMIF